MKDTFKQLPVYLFAGSILFFTSLMFLIVYPYFSFRYDIDFLLTKQTVLHILPWRIAFYTHISTSLVVMLVGGFQFIKSIMIRKPKIHRKLGKTYIFLVLLISAPSGLIMAFYANGGIPAKTSFVIISILWWVFTFISYKKAMDKDFKTHSAFIYRSYALTLSAITLRIYVMVFPHFFYLPAKDMYALVAWLSWIPNLAVAELLIRKSTVYKTGRII